MPDVTYDRPVPATLQVRLGNGDTFEASPEDLKKFGYLKRDDVFSDMYHRLIDMFVEAGLMGEGDRRDMTDLEISPLYNFFSYVLNHPTLIDHWENEGMPVEITNLERRLRGLEPLPVPTYEELRAKRDAKGN